MVLLQLRMVVDVIFSSAASCVGLQLESLRSPNFGGKGDWEPKKVEYPLSAKILHTRVRWKSKSQEGVGDQTSLSQAGVRGYAPW